MDEQKFESIRRRYVEAVEREEQYRSTVLLKRYAQTSPPTTWLTRTEESRLDSYGRAQGKAMDAMFALLDRISPRQWRTGVAAWWVMERLSYADATTSGPLSAIPQPGFGSTQREVERFAEAINEEGAA